MNMVALKKFQIKFRSYLLISIISFCTLSEIKTDKVHNKNALTFFFCLRLRSDVYFTIINVAGVIYSNTIIPIRYIANYFESHICALCAHNHFLGLSIWIRVQYEMMDIVKIVFNLKTTENCK